MSLAQKCLNLELSMKSELFTVCPANEEQALPGRCLACGDCGWVRGVYDLMREAVDPVIYQQLYEALRQAHPSVYES